MDYDSELEARNPLTAAAISEHNLLKYDKIEFKLRLKQYLCDLFVECRTLYWDDFDSNLFVRS